MLGAGRTEIVALVAVYVIAVLNAAIASSSRPRPTGLQLPGIAAPPRVTEK